MRILPTEIVIRKKVVDHFKHIDIYRARKGIVHEEDPFSLNFISSRSACEDEILSVGGSSSPFLDPALSSITSIHAFNVKCWAFTNNREKLANVGVLS